MPSKGWRDALFAERLDVTVFNDVLGERISSNADCVFMLLLALSLPNMRVLLYACSILLPAAAVHIAWLALLLPLLQKPWQMHPYNPGVLEA